MFSLKFILKIFILTWNHRFKWRECATNTDFHVNYNSVKCSPLATFVYQLNQSALLRGSVNASPGSGGSDGQHPRRSTSPHLSDKLANACAAFQAFDEDSDDCLRESSLLFLLLMLGTVWLGLSLYNFTKTSVLSYLLTYLNLYLLFVCVFIYYPKAAQT